ncbi:hypothetical protein AJ80_01774 [Polytolypa hystricis UAMH7299]|uniref:BZIP domain-containing protein n=1 Tax=Polytolypa hystricis (strain UAMH7299) TaxID=1447883 RepID=A0A2B7YZI2_POLH7|nr:hypothetical protein AJ80_01774 [Polytolypa hystricis UAMH7299]
MATTEEIRASTTLSPMAHLTSCFDPNDIDSFINYDQPIYPSPSLSPASSRAKMSVSQQSSNHSAASTPPGTTPSSSNAFGSSSQSSQLMFSAPSHEYDSYKQQTGLPPGGLANTLAMNQWNDPTGLGLGHSTSFVPDAFRPKSQSNATFDFASTPLPNFTLNNADMDVDLDGGMQPFPLYPLPQATPKAQFIDPNALGGEEMSPSAQPNQMRRVYPGMHQQQAAMAKAAQQQRQQEILRRQQQQIQQFQQQQQQQQQQQLPQQPQENNNQVRPGAKPPTKPKDPAVEERISRILQQMRQNSVSASEDGSGSQKPLPQMTKPRKDDDDMDEDERLLASEEGKKLSSKERRQLRNKVSARAFRSRRKEYIGQLETEVASKTNEANELRVQNRALLEENTRLTELTRMLLSSPNFASFLNDFSVSSATLPPKTEQPSQIQANTQPTALKDPNPSHMPQDVQMQNQQVGMAMIPEPAHPLANMDVNAPGWNSGIDVNFNMPVFAVLDVPEGPSIDSAVLSGKASNSVGLLSPDEPKDQVPTIERPPVDEPEAPSENANPCLDMEIDESDPSFALYFDHPPSTSEPAEDLFGGLEPEKVFARIDLVVGESSESESQEDTSSVSASTMLRFERLCASLEGAYHRVGLVTSHLEGN